jgi:hypothetical protein
VVGIAGEPAECHIDDRSTIDLAAGGDVTDHSGIGACERTDRL